MQEVGVGEVGASTCVALDGGAHQSYAEGVVAASKQVEQPFRRGEVEVCLALEPFVEAVEAC